MQLKIVRLCAVLVLWSLPTWAQAPENPTPAPQPPPKPQFFAGTVTALNAQQITVSRTPVGHSTERRTFLINVGTKMNKAVLKLRSRVTVKYQHLDQGDVALEIHLQPSTKSVKPS